MVLCNGHYQNAGTGHLLNGPVNPLIAAFSPKA